MSETKYFGVCLSILIGSILIACAIVAAPHLVPTQAELQLVPTQPEQLPPIAADDVARQFQANTSVPPWMVEVQEVRYSPTDDAYRVRYSWTHRETAETLRSDVTLNSVGYGRYGGAIRSAEFLEPTGRDADGSFSVVVEAPPLFHRE